MNGDAQPPQQQRLRLAWALTGSGHFFTECLRLVSRFADLDLFVSRAAAEVVRMYGRDLKALPEGTRIYRDTTASAAPVGLFYDGVYHTLVLAPATSNTVASSSGVHASSTLPSARSTNPHCR